MESSTQQPQSPFHIRKIWGEATGFLSRYQKIWWIDLVLLFGLIGLIFGMINVAGEWTGVHRPAVEIDLSPWALPKYTFFSLCRGMMAYVLSFIFTIAYGFTGRLKTISRKKF